MSDYLDYYAGKTVLVTGGAGAIGTNLVRELAKLGVNAVIILDNMTSSYRWNVPDLPNVMLVEGDICDETALKRVFQERPEIVFHLAAFFANQNSVDYPERDLMTNGMGTLKVFEYCLMTGVEKVLFASSGSSIYGVAAPLPLREESVSMYLSTPYQITKMLGELYSNFFHKHYGMNIVKTRFFNSFGPGEVPGQYRNVIPNFIYWAMKGRPLPITGDGQATRDFTYVSDLVDGMLRACYFPEASGAEMNLATCRETKIVDLANMINDAVGNKSGLEYLGGRKWDVKNRRLACVDHAMDLIGYSPKVPFEEGLEKTIRWFKDNWSNIERCAEFPPGMSSAVRKTGKKS